MPKYTNISDYDRLISENTQKSGDRLAGYLTNAAKVRAAGEQQQAQQQHEMAKMAETEAAGQRESDRSVKLADFLSNKYGPTRSVGVSGSGGVSIGSRDPLMGLLRQQSMEQAQQAREDSQLMRMGDRVEKAQIPQMASAAAALEAGTSAPGRGGMLSDPNYEVKSAGPVANALPDWMRNVGETVGLMPEGSSQERQLIQRLVNIDTKNFSGSALSAAEMGRNNIAQGLSPGGDPALVRTGVKQMLDAMEASGQNIRASANPNVVNKFKQQGGTLSLKDAGLAGASPAGGLSPEEMAELEQLKRELGR